jgi:hypothetical protein
MWAGNRRWILADSQVRTDVETSGVTRLKKK